MYYIKYKLQNNNGRLIPFFCYKGESIIKEKLKVLSLFSGIGAFEKALTNIGVDYKLINYCEIDNIVAKSYSIVHNTIQSKNLGDISLVDESKLDDFDLMTWGISVC